MDEVQDILSDHALLAALAAIFGVVNCWIAYKWGLFRYPFPDKPLRFPLPLSTVLSCFFVFLAVQVLVVPALLAVIFHFTTGEGGDLSKIHADTQAMGWTNVLSMAATFVGVMLGSCVLPPEQRRAIWWREVEPGGRRQLKSFFLGVVTWLVAYPVVTGLIQALSLLLQWLFDLPEVDQVAVKALKLTLETPTLFVATLLCMIVLVPVVEEFLFRGCLQTWLRGYFSRRSAIALSSVVFSLFHFSLSQGISNFTVVLGLFVLSCFLGFLYERQRTLWASIGLHAFFNAVSISVVVFF